MDSRRESKEALRLRAGRKTMHCVIASNFANQGTLQLQAAAVELKDVRQDWNGESLSSIIGPSPSGVFNACCRRHRQLPTPITGQTTAGSTSTKHQRQHSRLVRKQGSCIPHHDKWIASHVVGINGQGQGQETDSPQILIFQTQSTRTHAQTGKKGAIPKTRRRLEEVS